MSKEQSSGQSTSDIIESATNVSDFSLDNIDDFLPMPGADSIVTSEDDAPEKKGMFTNQGEHDLSFLDKTTDKDALKEVVQDALDNLDDDLESDFNSNDGKPSRRASSKSLSKLIDDGVLFQFEDDKDLSEYTDEDWHELVKANLAEKEREIREQTPKEFFEALPKELQTAAEYVSKGGTDMKGLFRALAQTEEQRSLDPRNEDHREIIARQYLNATNFGNGDNDIVEDQIQEWIDNGTLERKAQQFKPKLDEMQEQVLKSKLEKQESYRNEMIAKREAYMDNIFNTLKPSEINGVKLEPKRQKFLWDELTTMKYESLTGRNTNLLGKLLEDYQFGEKPRYDLIAESLWLLSDPEDYKEQIRKQIKNEVTSDTVRTLKTEQANKTSSHQQSHRTPEPTSRRKTIKREPTSIFRRN